MTLPDKITIQFRTADGSSFQQENILIGVQTFVEHKNDIDLSPFLTDKDGNIEISKADLNKTADDFISYGIMDYSTIESAKNEIELYLWTEKQIADYLDYWDKKEITDIESEVRTNPIFRMTSKQKEQLIKEFMEVDKKEKMRLEKFRMAFNKNLETSKTPRVVDQWDGRSKEYHYEMIVWSK